MRSNVPPWIIGAGSIAVALTVFFLVRTADPNAAPTRPK